MMKNLSDIIINPISCDKVKEMYLNDEITEGEYYLLMASRGELKDSLREVYIKNFLVGCAEYKLYYEDIDENLYFTNIEEVLASFYSLYEKLPNYNFDQVLKFMLNKLSPNQGYLYEILTIIYYQIMNEEKNFSPFKIITREMLENCRECLFRM